MKARAFVVPLLAAMAWASTSVGPALAHEVEEEVPAMDLFAGLIAGRILVVIGRAQRMSRLEDA